MIRTPWCSFFEQLEKRSVAELVSLHRQRPIQPRHCGRGAPLRSRLRLGGEPLLHVIAQQLLEGEPLPRRSCLKACEQTIRQAQGGAHAHHVGSSKRWVRLRPELHLYKHRARQIIDINQPLYQTCKLSRSAKTYHASDTPIASEPQRTRAGLNRLYWS